MSSLKFAHGSGELEVHTHDANITNGAKFKSKTLVTSSIREEKDLASLGNIVNPYTYEIVKESTDFILNQTKHRPKIGIICGSGLGGLANLLENSNKFPYDEIPHFPRSTVVGHSGQLVIGELGDVPVLCMQGRFHYYEGYPLWKVSMPIRVFKLMGIEILIVTNAAGGLNVDYNVGDIMFLKDHLNFAGMGGNSALRGPNDDRFGPRFPPLNTAYDGKLRLLARQVANELGMSDFVHEGVYAMVGGPSYETVAELRAMRILGADAVGMSTIPEVVVARHCGIRCFSFSLITNACIMDYDVDEEASHEEVVDTANRREADLNRFIAQLIPSIQQLQLQQ